MSTAPIIVSEHAVERYLERWVGHVLSRHQARVVLEVKIRTALHVEDIADEQQSIWKIDGATLLVVDDAGEVRTVLPPGATRPTRPRTKLP